MKIKKCFGCGASAPVLTELSAGVVRVDCASCDRSWKIERSGRSTALLLEKIKKMAPVDFYLSYTIPPLLQSEIRALDSLSRSFYADRPEVLNALLYFYVQVYGGTLNGPILDRLLFTWKSYNFTTGEQALAYCEKVIPLEKKKQGLRSKKI